MEKTQTYYTYYTDRFLLDADAPVYNAPAKVLTTIEKRGLEAVLRDFIAEYEEETQGEAYTNIENYTRYNEKSVDILDGYFDTYLFDNYAICEIYATERGCIILDCVDLDKYTGEDKEDFTQYEGDYYEIIEKFDIFSDFETAKFRLD